jgi:hypothetical protein
MGDKGTLSITSYMPVYYFLYEGDRRSFLMLLYELWERLTGIPKSPTPRRPPLIGAATPMSECVGGQTARPSNMNATGQW